MPPNLICCLLLQVVVGRMDLPPSNPGQPECAVKVIAEADAGNTAKLVAAVPDPEEC